MSRTSDTMTVAEVAKSCGLHRQTVYAMLKRGEFPVQPLPLPQRKLLFAKSEIQDFVKRRNRSTRFIQ